MTMNSPDSHSPITPPEVDETAAMVSALLDGELDSSELVDLEQYAVDHETTIQDLSAEMADAKNALAALASVPAPTAFRSEQLAAALVAMDSPEVKSLAAARAGRGSDGILRQANAQRLNDRLRRLTAVAAAMAVIGGVGFLSLQGGFGGSDDADEAAVSGDDSGGSAVALERSTQPGVADEGAGDSEMAEASEALEESKVPASDENGANDTTDFSQSGPLGPLEIVDGFNLADATLSDLPADVAARSSMSPDSTAPANEALCFAAAVQLVSADQIVEGIAVQQSGVEFELVVLIDGELLVFELPQCVQVD